MYIPEFWCGVIFTVIFEAVVITIESFYIKSKNKERRQKVESNDNSGNIKSVSKNS